MAPPVEMAAKSHFVLLGQPAAVDQNTPFSGATRTTADARTRRSAGGDLPGSYAPKVGRSRACLLIRKTAVRLARIALDGLCRLGLDGVNFALRFADCRPTHAIDRVLLAKLRGG